jgi:hypothetical protein
MRKWFGDNYVGPAYFGYPVNHGGDDIKHPEFEAVKARLIELADAGEVALIYCDDEGPVALVVAYRFTSDKAYCRYRDELVGLGGSLARGVWDIWSADPHAKNTYDTYFRANDDALKAMKRPSYTEYPPKK